MIDRERGIMQYKLFEQIKKAARVAGATSPEMLAAVESLGRDEKRPLGRFNPWAWCVEVTRGCNLACGFCPTRLYPPGERLFVSDETWGSALEIVNELMPYSRWMIANWGEPTLHPRFVELMKMGKCIAPNLTLLLYTNGTQILNGTFTYRELFEAGLDAIYVDVYSSREKHLELAMASGYQWWEEGKRLKNTKNLFERKTKQGHFIQISRNPAEWLPSKSNRGALMTFCNDLDWEAARKLGMTPVVHPPHRRCDQPVKFPTFVWNGYYVFCGQDVMNHTTGEYSDGKLGNVKDGVPGFLKFWLGRYMQDTRAKVHLCKDGRASHERCRQCCFVGGRADVPIWRAGVRDYWDGGKFVPLPPWVKVEAPNGELKRIFRKSGSGFFGDEELRDVT